MSLRLIERCLTTRPRLPSRPRRWSSSRSLWGRLFTAIAGRAAGTPGHPSVRPKAASPFPSGRHPAQWSLGSATRCTMSSYRAPGAHWARRLRDTEAAPCLLEVTAQKGNTSQRLGPVLTSSLSCEVAGITCIYALFPKALLVFQTTRWPLAMNN